MQSTVVVIEPKDKLNVKITIPSTYDDTQKYAIIDAVCTYFGATQLDILIAEIERPHVEVIQYKTLEQQILDCVESTAAMFQD